MNGEKKRKRDSDKKTFLEKSQEVGFLFVQDKRRTIEMKKADRTLFYFFLEREIKKERSKERQGEIDGR